MNFSSGNEFKSGLGLFFKPLAKKIKPHLLLCRHYHKGLIALSDFGPGDGLSALGANVMRRWPSVKSCGAGAKRCFLLAKFPFFLVMSIKFSIVFRILSTATVCGP